MVHHIKNEVKCYEKNNGQQQTETFSISFILPELFLNANHWQPKSCSLGAIYLDLWPYVTLRVSLVSDGKWCISDQNNETSWAWEPACWWKSGILLWGSEFSGVVGCWLCLLNICFFYFMSFSLTSPWTLALPGLPNNLLTSTLPLPAPPHSSQLISKMQSWSCHSPV